MTRRTLAALAAVWLAVDVLIVAVATVGAARRERRHG